MCIDIFDTMHGNAALSGIFVSSFNHGPLAFDAGGKLCVPDGIDTVMVFDTEHGNVKLPTISGNGLNMMNGVAVDASGKLYVDTGANSVVVFNMRRSNAPLPSITAAVYGVRPEWSSMRAADCTSQTSRLDRVTAFSFSTQRLGTNSLKRLQVAD